MARKMLIALGCKVKDVVSGFTGIATSRHVHYSGAVQIGIQPLVDKKTPGVCPDAISFDEVQVQYVGAGHRKLADQNPPSIPFALGDEVRDRVTGYTGIAMRHSVWMNGCVNIGIVGKAKEGDKPEKGQNVDLQTVERVGPGLNAAPKTATPEPARKPGGAPQRVERA